MFIVILIKYSSSDIAIKIPAFKYCVNSSQMIMFHGIPLKDPLITTFVSVLYDQCSVLLMRKYELAISFNGINAVGDRFNRATGVHNHTYTHTHTRKRTLLSGFFVIYVKVIN